MFDDGPEAVNQHTINPCVWRHYYGVPRSRPFSRNEFLGRSCRTDCLVNQGISTLNRNPLTLTGK
jgi:hypothetical protein